MNILNISALQGQKILKIRSKTEVTLTSTDTLETQNDLHILKEEMAEAKLIYEMMNKVRSGLELAHSRLCGE